LTFILLNFSLCSFKALAQIDDMDPRFTELADVLTGFSTRLEAGEKVLIEATNIPDEMVLALMRAARKRGAIPFVHTNHGRIVREFILDGTEEQFQQLADDRLSEMKQMNAFIALRGADNIYENSDIPIDLMNLYMRLMRPLQNYRVRNTKWVVLRWPHAGMAQQARMSTEAFEDFYFRVCCLDYARLRPGMAALAEAINKARMVRITGPGTDLRFSLEGMGAVTCGGDRNIPDGEVYSAPVRESVEGMLTYNVPSVHLGDVFEGITFEFSKGRIITASCAGGKTEKLNQILDSDDGARFIGEFAIGFNPHIREPIFDTLFDEKIAGSFHFTPGQAYTGTPADNGNSSQLHWDIVNIQRPEYGGGEIIFDGQVIRRDGLFVPTELQALNPENLLAQG
jgi:aminopeptidase